MIIAILTEYILLGLALAADAASVSLVYGSKQQPFSWRKSLFPSFSFGFAQGIMPIIGWYGGALLSSFIEAIDHWIAFVILLVVGIKFIWDSRQPQDVSKPSRVSGWALFLAAFATSSDAGAVGCSLHGADQPIWMASRIIAITTFGCSLIAHWIGSRLGSTASPDVLIIVGLIRIGLGAEVLLEHLEILAV